MQRKRWAVPPFFWERPKTAKAYNSGFTHRSLRSLGARGPSLAPSCRLLRDRNATACASARGCPFAQPATAFTALAYATAAPALQVRKPACRYTQWPFWGKVLAGWGSRIKTRNDLVVPAGNEDIIQDHPKKSNSSPPDFKIGIFPSSRPLLVRQIKPFPMPPRRHLSYSDPVSQT